MAIAIYVTHAATFQGVLEGVEDSPGLVARLLGRKAPFVGDLDMSAVEEALAREPSVVGAGCERRVVDAQLGFGQVATVTLRSDCVTFTMSPTQPKLVESWTFLLQVAVRVADRSGAGVWDGLTKLPLTPPNQAAVIARATHQLQKLESVVSRARSPEARW